MQTTPVTQFGLPEPQYCDPTTARYTIIPAGLEYTTSYMKGTQYGPQAILNASSQIEDYDEELDRCPIEVGVYTTPPLNYDGLDHASALQLTGDAAHAALQRGQIPITLGGEHSLSAPIIAALHKRYPDLTVVHIDAHGDLRDSYEDTPLSHASIERRVVEMNIPLLEIGIRSISSEEIAFLRSEPQSDVAIIWAHQFAHGNHPTIPWERLSAHTYVTIDLDALDPSAMPAVGTPEPGGLNWYQVLALFKAICQRTTIVGMDVVELCPRPEQAYADFLAAKLVYKLIGYHAFLSASA